MSFSVSSRRKNTKTEQVCRIRALIYYFFSSSPVACTFTTYEWQVVSLQLVIQNSFTCHEFASLIFIFFIWHESLLVKNIMKWWVKQMIHSCDLNYHQVILPDIPELLHCKVQWTTFTFSMLLIVLQTSVTFLWSYPSRLPVLLYLTSSTYWVISVLVTAVFSVLSWFRGW